MKTRRYSIRLRPCHPHEARLIADLVDRPTGRRATRIRELLLLGLNSQPPAVNWTDPLAPGDGTMRALRVAVLIHDRDPSDAPIRQRLAHVHADLVGDFLREKLAAGLLGRANSPIDTPAFAAEAPNVLTFADAADLSVSTLESPTRFEQQVHAQAMAQAQDSLDDHAPAPIKRPELMGLFA